jgi:hypothetical protein
MPIFKKGHHYQNKNPKKSSYINSIMPLDDREVPKILFDSFEDVTEKRRKEDEPTPE